MISIVILTKDGGNLFQQIIARLMDQRVNDDFEVITVDSGSKDGTAEFLQKSNVRFFQISPRYFRFGSARQFAFSKARGEFIVTMSQDVLPFDESYINLLVNPLVRREADVVQGVTVCPENPELFYWETIGAFYFTSEGREFFSNSKQNWLSCTSLAINKKAWVATGFDNIPYCEDKYLQLKLQKAGFRIKILEKAIAWHGHHYSLAGLMKRCYNEGLGWKYASVKYKFNLLIKDLIKGPWRYKKKIIQGILKGRAMNPASLLFFQIRPIFLFIGNRIIPYYWS